MVYLQKSYFAFCLYPNQSFCKFQYFMQGQIFIYLKGGVEKFRVGCKRHHSVSFNRGSRRLG
jgi:hypothetical protein